MSRRIPVLTLALIFLIVPGCHDHDNIITPPQTVTVELRYDGDNDTAPNLPIATYEAAARFTTAQTGTVTGGELLEVLFYIQSAPDDCRVKV